MLLASGLPPLDLSPLFQFVFTVLLLALGLLYLVKATASRYFVVDDDARFNAVHSQPPMPAAAADPDPMPAAAADPDPMPAAAADPDPCFVCGQSTSKLCSRCKAVRYCSTICQSKHWKEDHKNKCKELKRSNNVDSSSSPSPSGVCGKRKASLVPARGTCKVLQQPKKVLFPYGEFVKLFNWETSGFPPCGLLNCGNSCYANVVLQCLACTRPLVAFLLEKGHSRKCNRNDWCFLCELQSHLHRVSQSLHPFSPINILSRLPNIGGNLGYGKQEDAHEFMRFAIDMMQSICLDEFGGEKVLDPSTQETTLIQHIFGGHLKSQVICTQCNKISYRYENMMDLTVEIQGDAASLEDCLDQFTVKEWLDGDNMYKCDGCNDYVKAWKRLTIHQAPNILTIALKRFQSGRFGKLNKRVTFPETLDLGPYMSEAGDGSDVYKLYAVVVHIDMLNASFFGHYICYTTDFSGYWYRIDDCKVMEVELEEVLAQGAYMLLYSRICARQPNVKSLEHLRKAESQSLDVAKEVQGSRDSVESLEIAESANSEAGPSFPLSDINQWSGDLGYGREPSTEIHSKESEYLSLVDPIKVVSKSIRENPDDLGLSSVQLSSSEELGRNCTRSLHAVGDGSSEELEHGEEPLNTVSSLELSGAHDMEWQETDTSSPNVQCKEVGTWDNQNREFQLAESSLDDYDTNEMEETSSAVSVAFVSYSLEVPQEATSTLSAGYSEPGLEQVVVACDKTVSTSGLDNKENPDDLGLSCVQLSFSEELGRNCTSALHAVGDGSSEELKHGEDPLNTVSSLELSSAHDMEWQETDTSSPNVQCNEVGTWDIQNREFQLAESSLDDYDTNEMEETSPAVSVAFVSSALEAPQEATSTLSAGYSEPGLEQVVAACDRTVSASGLDNSCRNGFMETDSADRSCCKVNDCDASPEKFYDKNKDLLDCKNLLMTPRTCNKFSGRSLDNDEATENMVNHSYNGFANPPFPQQNGNWVPGHVVRGTKLSLDYVKSASYDPNCKHPAEELHACKVETNGNGFVKSALTDQHAGRANEQDENRSCH